MLGLLSSGLIYKSRIEQMFFVVANGTVWHRLSLVSKIGVSSRSTSTLEYKHENRTKYSPGLLHTRRSFCNISHCTIIII